ncbi:hypothetical protein QJS10_CPA07g00614 [Acorus calamus]|uniref:Uncharacterized protein n=1 Tax=Acorus calamus TaxID=4465 RepID=A0AAV9EGW5_ACOCL|nr:hypothetical protein QJS10_CPA07g00614 [Acorus calamus]
MRGDPIIWVSTHRHYHQYCDTTLDPHSPINSFWFSHMAYLSVVGQYPGYSCPPTTLYN